MEYRAHRFGLHNPLRPTRHSHMHHRYASQLVVGLSLSVHRSRSGWRRFYTMKAMEFETWRDVHTIFFGRTLPLHSAWRGLL
jgi:hypothetical protein